MKLIELHILQSFPVSCLNRDDVGAPKSAVFGGVNRARISSQCLKMAIRKAAQEMTPALFAGQRSRLFIAEIVNRLTAKGIDQKEAESLAKCVAHYLSKLDAKDNAKVKTLMFLSKDEYGRLAKLLAELPDDDRKELCQLVERIRPDELDKADDEDESAEGTNEDEPAKKTKDKGKPFTAKQFTKRVSAILKARVRKEFEQGFVKDAADIAIFGRMVASDHSLTLEGAGMFSHALSTHKAQNHIDFFAAVDDLQKAEESGAGMTGTLEFTSATYYRYAALNMDLLWKEDHLAALSPAERRTVVDTFLRAALMAVPGARKNSMNANTLPGYVLGIVKEKGQPIQLVNAFEKPATPRNGHMEASRDAMKEHYASLKKTWGLSAALEIAIPDVGLDEFCKGILKHV